MGIASAGYLAGGLLSYLSGKENNAANLAANKANVESQKKNRDLIAASGNQTGNPLGSQTFGPEGFTQNFGQPGSDAAETLRLRNQGDIGRAGQVNDATNNFAFSVPNLSASRAIGEQNNNRRQSTIDDTISQNVLQNKRTLGRDNNSGADANLIAAMSRFDAGREGEDQAIGRLQAGQQGDLKTLQQQIAAFQPQGLKAEQFPQPNQNVAALLAQAPPGQVIPDLGGTVLADNTGSALKSYFDAQELQRQEGRSDAARKDLLAAYTNRGLGNQINAPIQAPITLDNTPPALPKLLA
jgi:hypothetical protein